MVVPEISNQRSELPGNAPVLEIRHLYKAFGENRVLCDFNLEIDRAESLVVLGRSGSGKSVLIKCVIGLIRPDYGEILVFGEDVLALNHDQLDKNRARIGFLFQSNALYDSMTVRENLEFPLRRHWIDLETAMVDKMVEEALDDVGLLHTIDMMPVELSGGMRKRIALARTLILKPELVLYDEPTTGLDPVTGKEIIDLMIQLKEKYGTTSLIISHDMNCVRTASSRIVVLVDGICYATGTYDQLSQNPDPKVKQFFQ